MSLLAKNNRPAGTAFKQQKLTAWQSILTPKWIICAFAIIVIILIVANVTIIIALIIVIRLFVVRLKSPFLLILTLRSKASLSFTHLIELGIIVLAIIGASFLGPGSNNVQLHFL